jgi:hypothetical protein
MAQDWLLVSMPGELAIVYWLGSLSKDHAPKPLPPLLPENQPF